MAGITGGSGVDWSKNIDKKKAVSPSKVKSSEFKHKGVMTDALEDPDNRFKPGDFNTPKEKIGINLGQETSDKSSSALTVHRGNGVVLPIGTHKTNLTSLESQQVHNKGGAPQDKDEHNIRPSSLKGSFTTIGALPNSKKDYYQRNQFKPPIVKVDPEENVDPNAVGAG
jgi:hypothetical protein